jgi:23S rRNA pseudouridine1911/1915/1917 synthase
MMIAKTPYAQHLMQRQLHTPGFRRRYLALTDGIPEKRLGMIDLPIAKAPGATVKREIHPEGKPSRTRYRVLGEKDGKALILLELETGRTHQIRVHLSHIGCPVRGDFLYGTERPEEYPGCFALHSAMLDTVHPLSGERIRLTSVPAWAERIETDVLFMDFD